MRPLAPELGVIYRVLNILPGSITLDLGVALIELLRVTPAVICLPEPFTSSSKLSSSSKLHLFSSGISIVRAVRASLLC